MVIVESMIMNQNIILINNKVCFYNKISPSLDLNTKFLIYCNLFRFRIQIYMIKYVNKEDQTINFNYIKYILDNKSNNIVLSYHKYKVKFDMK